MQCHNLYIMFSDTACRVPTFIDYGHYMQCHCFHLLHKSLYSFSHSSHSACIDGKTRLAPASARTSSFNGPVLAAMVNKLYLYNPVHFSCQNLRGIGKFAVLNLREIGNFAVLNLREIENSLFLYPKYCLMLWKRESLKGKYTTGFFNGSKSLMEKVL